MQLENKNPVVILICGKAKHGKSTVATMIEEVCFKKIINLEISSYIKEYAKKISNWDGSSETKPRTLLQQIGTSIIRDNIDENLLIRRTIEDIQVFSYFFDMITISDIRLKKEIQMMKNKFHSVISIHIVRPNFDNGLTEEEKHHLTEIDLDDFNSFDYEIVNDGTLEDLKENVVKIVNEIQRR